MSIVFQSTSRYLLAGSSAALSVEGESKESLMPESLVTISKDKWGRKSSWIFKKCWEGLWEFPQVVERVCRLHQRTPNRCT